MVLLLGCFTVLLMKSIQVAVIQNLPRSACCCFALYEAMKCSGYWTTQANSKVPALSQCWRMREFSRCFWGCPRYQTRSLTAHCKSNYISEEALFQDSNPLLNCFISCKKEIKKSKNCTWVLLDYELDLIIFCKYFQKCFRRSHHKVFNLNTPVNDSVPQHLALLFLYRSMLGKQCVAANKSCQHISPL